MAAIPPPTAAGVDSLERKRTRKGEQFTDPRDVNLHAVDFTFADALAELTADQWAWFLAYRATCVAEVQRLRLLSSGTTPLAPPPSPAPAVAVATPSPVALPQDESSSLVQRPPPLPLPPPPRDPWERHYIANKGLFPVKNYIVHAFRRSIVPAGFDFDAAMRAAAAADSAGEDAANGAGSPLAVRADRPSPDPTAVSSGSEAPCQRTIMECGCGSGSTILPLMRLFPRDRFVCFDVSQTAVDMLQGHRLRAMATHASIFSCDIAAGGAALDSAMAQRCPDVPKGSVDVVLLIFVLCALPSVAHMVAALRQLRAWLHPTRGRLLFRDFAILDHNFFRYHTQGNVATAASKGVCFLKGDGTMQSFFDMDYLTDVMRLAGFAPCADDETQPDAPLPPSAGPRPAMEFHCNRLVNRKNGKTMNKMFINATFAPVEVTDEE